ncbi:MAG: hypothetical protein K6G94_04735 [Kiritimatiellae bacterium]|nr:hypothetical protein [Kiritimatiellia bacterium]
MLQIKRLRFVLLAAALASAFAGRVLSAETVRVVDCVRDASLDVWAAPDVRYAHEVMDEVFKTAGPERSHDRAVTKPVALRERRFPAFSCVVPVRIAGVL